MSWIFWLAIANLAIFILEWTYRAAYFTGFWSSLHILIFPILLGQLGLFYGFKLAPSLFLAGAVFTLANQLLRVGNSVILGERVGAWQLLGVFLMVIAVLVFKK